MRMKCDKCGTTLSVSVRDGMLSLVCSSCGHEVVPEPAEQKSMWNKFLDENLPARFKKEYESDEILTFQGEPIKSTVSSGMFVTV